MKHNNHPSKKHFIRSTNAFVDKAVENNEAVRLANALAKRGVIKQNPIFTPPSKSAWHPLNPSFIESMLRGGK